MPTASDSVRPVLILHTGDPDDVLMAGHGSYAAMLQRAAGLGDGDTVVAAVHREQMPESPRHYRAALITGSPAMVTDREPWSEACAQWLRAAAAAGLPLFGICYGHQLIAHALGGQVGDNPAGREIGTQIIELTGAAHDDGLAASLPGAFPAQTMHRQSVLALPPGARVLAGSAADPHQMVCWGPGLYSTQFHPEFTPAFVQAHLLRHAASYAHEQIDAQALAQAVTETPQAAALVRRFLDACAA